MPELPELTVVQEVLTRRAVGQTILRVEVLPAGGAIVVRDLTQTGFDLRLTGARIESVLRRGKFLVFTLARPAAGPSDPSLFLAINPKLTGRLQLAAPSDRRYARTHVVLGLSSGEELRYVDQKRMGQIYLTYDLNQVPDYAGMGPEPFDASLEGFRARLRPFRGETKGILTRGEFIAGIGNAYSDEILWAAQIHPYRKRTSLSDEEVTRLYEAMQSTLRAATDIVRGEIGDNIYLKPREFLSVHGKAGQPCPRCGTPISLVSAHQRITNFCRKCQPGGLIKGM